MFTAIAGFGPGDTLLFFAAARPEMRGELLPLIAGSLGAFSGCKTSGDSPLLLAGDCALWGTETAGGHAVIAAAPVGTPTDKLLPALSSVRDEWGATLLSPFFTCVSPRLSEMAVGTFGDWARAKGMLPACA